MDQLTVRGFGDDLGNALRRLATREKKSLNQAALRLLRRGAGLDNGTEQRNTVGSSLDHLIGVWTSEEADEFHAAIKTFETIDPQVWD